MIYCWKAFNEGYNFVVDLISIGGLHAKLWALNAGVLVVGKWHLGVSPMVRHILYFKGEGGGFSQV